MPRGRRPGQAQLQTLWGGAGECEGGRGGVPGGGEIVSEELWRALGWVQGLVGRAVGAVDLV